MKKFIVAMFALAMLCVPAYAFEASVPQFEVWVDGVKLEHRNTEYPLLIYKDITYFPMTYDYVHMLGLINSWVDGEFYLSFCPGKYDRPSYEWVPEAASVEGEIASYPIYVNGKLIDNSNEEYPIINARGITYFPLTWRFATEEFGMELAWDGRLAISTGSNFGIGRRLVGDKVYFNYLHYEFRFLEDGTFYYPWAESLKFVFDASEGTVAEDDQALQSGRGTVYVDVDVVGSNLTYDGIPIDDVSDIQKLDNSLNVWGCEYDLGGGKVLLETVMNHYILSDKSYKRWYLRDGTSFTRLDLDEDRRHFVRAEYINGVNWLCMVEGKELDSDTYKLFTVTADNTLVPVTDPDHENIKLLGQIDGRPVVKATWQTEKRGRVSAVNDGYFTVEADGSLNKIYNYLFCNGTVIIDGHLYLFIIRNNTIVDVTEDRVIKY